MKRNKLRILFDGPEHGWLTVTLSDANSEYTWVPSHVVYDSVFDLASALLAIIGGADEAVVRWNEEPAEHELLLTRDGDRLRVTIFQMLDSLAGRVRALAVFTHEDMFLNVMRALWKGMRDLETAYTLEEYERRWRSPFPAWEVAQVGDAIKRLSAAGSSTRPN